MSDNETNPDGHQVMTRDIGTFRRAAGTPRGRLRRPVDDERAAVPDALRRRSDRLLDRTLRDWSKRDD
jgi:hypothetical protein